MKELVFLPDREGRDELSGASGFVRLGKDGAALQKLADRLVLPSRQAAETDETKWRGILALALLADAWPDSGVRVTTMTVDGTTSLFSAWVLSARPEQERRDALHLVLLEKADQRRLLGIADAHRGLRLPATATDFAGFVPARATWYDPGDDLWHDPVAELNEHDRAILLARLTLMGLDDPAAAALKADLAEADKPGAEAVQAEAEDALRALSVRIQAVCGLADFEALTLRREPSEVSQDNPLVRLYAGVDVRYSAQRECSTWLWRGIPFARSGAVLGLTGTANPRQAEALDELERELQLLTEHSVCWNQRCAAQIDAWLQAQDEALLPQVRARAEALRMMHDQRGREVQMTVTLTWPWDASSGAVRYLLQEALGDQWMAGAAKPFSDRLTKLTGHVLGDRTLQTCCACADGVLLPPLSRELAACVATAGEGEGLAADMLRFEPREDGGITASFLLRGRGGVQMTRVYPVEEILVLQEETSPCVAVWPCLPLERWRAYHVFARCGETAVAALSGGEWKTLQPEIPTDDEAAAAGAGMWRCLHTDTYPACLAVLQGEQCLGVLPNALPPYRVEAVAEAQVSLDMGASATAAAILLDGKPISAAGEQLTRVLVNPQEMPADDFLLGLMPAELTPSSVMLTGEGTELFEDGYVYAAPRFEALRDMQPGAICTALKWRSDARSARARRILLQQVMLGASLNAMLAGARSIRWRVTVADEMGDEGREALLAMVNETAASVAEKTGLLLETKKPAVVWAEEAAALHAFLCAEGGMKGTFAVLDVGGGSTKLHLWMQGRNRPVGGAVLMEGASTALLAAFRAKPDMLYEDFADCGNEALLAAAGDLCGQLTHAGESLAQADHALLMLDALLEEYKQPIVKHLYERFMNQRPAHMQAILLEMYASLVFSAGLMLEHAGNDAGISHLFPADLTICLTGRGSWLLDTLTPQLRNGLQRIAHAPMQLRHPVRTLTVRSSVLPAMGVARGMAALRETGATISTPVIRTRQSFSELMRLLMLQLQQCYPLHVWKLHPGLFDAWGNMSAEGEALLRKTASACYGDGEDIPASVMDFMRDMRNAVIQPDSGLATDE